MLNKRKFETPYNFDEMLLFALEPYRTSIDTFYIPMFNPDGLTTRMKCRKYPSPTTRKEYESHINRIMSGGYRPNVLIQDPITRFSNETLKWYLDQGVKDFTVYQDSVAYALKELNPDVNVIASITKRLQPDEIRALPKGLYDNVVLTFAYNHSLDVIKSLPDTVDYTMIANVECNQDCWGLHHWFPSLELKDGVWTRLPDGQERSFAYCNVLPEDSAIVFPQYLHYYDDKIKIYKMVDRAFPTYKILKFIQMYAECQENAEAPDDYLNRKNIRSFTGNIKLIPNGKN